jgi:hypothetical protein
MEWEHMGKQKRQVGFSVYAGLVLLSLLAEDA